MHAPRQLHELMLCGEAAEHQLALISDAAEITDTYLTPPDEVQSARSLRLQKECVFANLLFKKWRSQHHTQKKTSVMSIANPKEIINHYFGVQNVFKAGREMSSVLYCI